MPEQVQREIDESTAAPSLRVPFERLREAYRKDPYPSFEARIRALDTLLELTRSNQELIAEAIGKDFGHRSIHDTKLAEIFHVVQGIKYIKSHLREWMEPERRHTALTFAPGVNEVHYQPLGVVGIISPWNYPYQLALGPIAYAIAAGNRVMLKPSELTPATGELMKELLTTHLDPDLIDVCLGGPDVAAEFASLPFDHLLFTGSTRVGYLVMQAAAKNLTPVTLELGGKSPTLIHPAYNHKKAAARIVAGKLFNAGQTCIAPDYVLVHESRKDELVQALREEIPRRYPRLEDNPDYTAVINDRHRQRIQALVDQAVKKGAKKVEINPAGESFDGPAGKMPPILLTDVDDEMEVMQEEIFGPVLPIVTYKDIDEAIEYINDHPRPLALYYFDDDGRRADAVLTRTCSGGACVNETLLHNAQDDLPFGGVGSSGMGAYHGIEGFETFSHKKAVFRQAKLNTMGLMAPPYGKRIETLLKLLIGR